MLWIDFSGHAATFSSVASTISPFLNEICSKVVDEDFPENAVYLPHKQTVKAGAPTPAGRIHHDAQTTSRRAGP